jgi:hypothetical protein
MKNIIRGVASALAVCSVSALMAQEANEVEVLRRQVRELQQQFEQVHQKQRAQIEALQQQVNTLRSAPKLALPPPGTATGDRPSEALSAKVLGTPAPGGNPPPVPWKPSDPLRLGSGKSAIDIGLVGSLTVGSSTARDVASGTQSGGHDPNQRGFTLQGLEMSLSGSVDPYFRGNANLVYALDADGESAVELEEAWLETMALPGNLQVRAGQIYSDFGRHNPTHLHSWGFLDTPLVNGRLLGPDGLRNPGARVSWLAPLPFFAELSLGVQNSSGGTAASFRSAGGHNHGGGGETLPLAYRHADNDRGVRQLADLLLSPRYAMSFDLTDSQTILMGASGAFGPNSRGGSDGLASATQIYGTDLTWKWKSPRHSGGFPFVTWQNEAMLRRYQAGAFDWDAEGSTTGGLDPAVEIQDLGTGLAAVLPQETLTDYGGYSQLLYGFRKGWVAGMRFDYLGSRLADYERMPLAFNGATLERDPQRAPRWRLSPNLTWHPTEYSKLRLQYNYDDRFGLRLEDHSVWLQFEFLLGAHAAHKF